MEPWLWRQNGLRVWGHTLFLRVSRSSWYLPSMFHSSRGFIATEEAKLHLGFLTLCDLDFYGNPVELEVVDALLLGFSVDVHQRIVQYRQPDLRQI